MLGADRCFESRRDVATGPPFRPPAYMASSSPSTRLSAVSPEMQSHSPPIQPLARHCVEILRSIASDAPRTLIHPMLSGPPAEFDPTQPNDPRRIRSLRTWKWREITY